MPEEPTTPRNTEKPEFSAITLQGIAHNAHWLNCKDGDCEEIINLRFRDGNWQNFPTKDEVWQYAHGCDLIHYHPLNETESSTGEDTTFFYIGYRIGGSHKHFNHDDITTPQNIFTIVNHGFGPVGRHVYLKYTQGTSPITGLTNGSSYEFEILTDSTLFLITAHIMNKGTGHDHTFTLNNQVIAFLPDEDYEIHILNLVTETVTRFTHLNNIIIINTNAEVHFMFWDYDNQQYTYLSHPVLPALSLPQPVLDEEFDAIYKEEIEMPHDGNVFHPDYIIAQEYPEFAEYFSKLVDYQNNKKKNNVYVESYVMVIVAYRLFDGSFIMHSQPLLTYIGKMNSYLDFKAEYSVTSYNILRNSGYFDIFGGNLKLNLNNTNIRGLTDQWRDIISGLTIFMTRPMPYYTFPQTGTGYNWQRYLATVGVSQEGKYYVQSSAAIKDLVDDPIYFRVKEIPWDELTDSQHAKQTIEFGLNDDVTKTERTDMAYFMPIDNFSHHRLLSEQQYVYNRRLHQGNVTTIFGDIDTQLLTDPYFEETAQGDGFTPISAANALPDWEFYAEVTIRSGSGSRYRVQKFTPNLYMPPSLSYDPGIIYPGDGGSSSGSWSLSGSGSSPIRGEGPLGPGDWPVVTIPFMPVVSYADPRATKLRVIIHNTITGKYFQLCNWTLKAHPFLSMAYYANYGKVYNSWTASGEQDPNYYGYEHYITGFANDDTFHNQTEAVLETDNRYYLDENRLQVSHIDNPFVNEAKHSYQVGGQDSKILGLATSAVQVSEGQYGEFPLFIFTNEGVYTLKQGIDPSILYSALSPVSKERLIPGTLCEIGPGIIYCTVDGVKIMSGTQIKNLSEKILLNADNPLLMDATYKYLINGEGKAVVDMYGLLDGADFKRYLSGAKIAYDSYQNEVIVCNSSYAYSYVYNLKFDVWSKIAQVWDYFIPIAPKFYGVKEDSLEDMEVENWNEDCSVLIQTKPIKLGSQGFKSIGRLVIRQHFLAGTSEQSTSSSGAPIANYEVEGVYVWGSGDGVEWKLIRGVNVHKPDYAANGVPRIVIPMSHVSVRYLIVMLAAKTTDFNFSHIEITCVHKMQNKLR